MVPDYCFDFCMNKTPTFLDRMHVVCLEWAADIAGCYMEGQGVCFRRICHDGLTLITVEILRSIIVSTEEVTLIF